MKLCLIAVCALSLAGAQFSAGVELVSLNISVVDPGRQFIADLAADDFSVFDNGRRQDVAFFGAAALPLDVVLLLDLSGSMGGRLPLAAQAAVGLVDRLRPGDRAAVFSFTNSLHLEQGLTTDREALRAAILRVQPYGRTALFDALYVISRELERDRRTRGEIRRQAVVALTDGVDTASRLSPEDSMRAVRRSGATLYAVAPQGNPEDPHTEAIRQATSEAEYYLGTLARDTGGRLFLVTDPDTLPEIYLTVAAELHHQYTLAFKPKPQPPAGGPRRLVVQIASHPEASVRTRRYYERRD